MLLGVCTGKAEQPEVPQPAVTAPAVSNSTEVVVKGQRALLLRDRETPSVASTVIVGEQLREAGVDSAGLVARAPGVTVNRSGGRADFSSASVRGTNSQQTPVYLAGIRINDEVSGGADLSQVPVWLLRRVRVYRGNAPVGAERFGLGGAVFFDPRIARGNEAGAGVSIGSFGERSIWLTAGGGHRDTSTLLAARYEQANNDYSYLNDQGQRFVLDERRIRRLNADHASVDLWSVSTARLTRTTRAQTVLNLFSREHGVVGLAIVPAQAARARERRLLAGTNLRGDCDWGQVCEWSVVLQGLNTTQTVNDAKRELPGLGSRWAHNSGLRLAAETLLTAQLHEQLMLAGVARVAQDSLKLTRDSLFSNRATRSSLWWSGQATFTWKDVELSALSRATHQATQAEYTEIRQRRRARESNLLSPFFEHRLGGVYKVSEELEFAGNAASYARVPSLGELYGASTAVSGNPDLKRERGLSLDVGGRVSHTFGPVDIDGELFGFYRSAKDLVAYRRSSFFTFSPYNVGQARFFGAEGALAVAWQDSILARTQLTFLNPRDVTPGQPTLRDNPQRILPLQAPLVFEQELRVRYDLVAGQSLEVGARYRHRASRFASPSGQVILRARRQADLLASYLHVASGTQLRAAMRNLANADNVDLLGQPLPGRTFNLSLEIWR